MEDPLLEQSAPQRKNLSPDRYLALRGVRILLVEDEPDIADLLTLILALAGATVMIVSHSEEALLLLDHMRSDILIIDIKLPDHDGDWLMQKIRNDSREKIRQLPAIAITSYAREVCSERILAAGFEQLLPKLADPEELILTVRKLLNKTD